MGHFPLMYHEISWMHRSCGLGETELTSHEAVESPCFSCLCQDSCEIGVGSRVVWNGSNGVNSVVTQADRSWIIQI